MTVYSYYDEETGTPCSLDDDGLVLPDGATEDDRFDAWLAIAEADAFWVLFPEALTDTDPTTP
ncbi:MAG: hypothetical protein ACRDMV_24850 [Streptosporangiales bacterium]